MQLGIAACCFPLSGWTAQVDALEEAAQVVRPTVTEEQDREGGGNEGNSDSEAPH